MNDAKPESLKPVIKKLNLDIMSGPTLRTPFKTLENTTVWAADKVEVCVNSITSNKFVTVANKSATKFESELILKTNPLFAYLPIPAVVSRPVIPYIQKGETAVGRTGLIATIISMPVVFFAMFMIVVTSPMWMFVALLTSFFWVPVLLICSFFVVPMIVVTTATIFFSRPKGRSMVTKQWNNFKASSIGKKVCFSSASPSTTTVSSAM
mmetsp:Transcript_55898/g.90512  ORF Transcript_55898/g.90512 Transcript_55898/m.90512 type:complete len:209 (+) Transcript_55898:121-747(+)